MKNVFSLTCTHSVGARIEWKRGSSRRPTDPYGCCPFMEITVIYFADKIVIESAWRQICTRTTEWNGYTIILDTVSQKYYGERQHGVGLGWVGLYCSLESNLYSGAVYFYWRSNFYAFAELSTTAETLIINIRLDETVEINHEGV